MSLRVVGAGLGRTGTHSLKLALEQLLGAPCYHMIEVFQHPEHVPMWRRAAEGDMPDWDVLFDGYVAAVDWPVGSFWREVSEAYPDSIIVLSDRDPESWWKSASSTIFQSMDRMDADPAGREWHQMITTMFRTRFTTDISDAAAAKEAFARHNDDVRRTAPRDRFLDWSAAQGWAPLCAALDVPVPDTPFPHVNTTEQFRAMAGLDAQS